MFMAENFLEYKGRPLVRSGNMIFYGSLADEFVIMMLINSEKTVNGVTIADKISIELQHTDPAVPPKDRVVKRGEKNGLYNALDIASIWLERALSGK
jgi:hypothetical protein